MDQDPGATTNLDIKFLLKMGLNANEFGLIKNAPAVLTGVRNVAEANRFFMTLPSDTPGYCVNISARFTHENMLPLNERTINLMRMFMGGRQEFTEFANNVALTNGERPKFSRQLTTSRELQKQFEQYGSGEKGWVVLPDVVIPHALAISRQEVSHVLGFHVLEDGRFLVADTLDQRYMQAPSNATSTPLLLSAL